eukprot:NODE_983_length_1185_cov_74.101232_g743_i0.p1 GENE.NODE_983_length_1185_cov_74.101232_g743_i0~~NODE_983_length_1185_cov_74.101232_g743_i0.p1  ORF type:complete len:376 (-),score=105.37 NODE_983_length_1185_cov_74.101232_g743_i0:58-1125(-)
MVEELEKLQASFISNLQEGVGSISTLLQKQQAQLHAERECLVQDRLKFEEEKLLMASANSAMISRVKLNVGGSQFETTTDTLTKDKGSMLETMFSGRFSLQTDAEGVAFIDRDGDVFAEILQYLRNGTLELPDSQEGRLRLMREADYYCLKDLIQQIKDANALWWATSDITLQASLKLHSDYVLCLCVVDNWLVSGSSDATIQVCDLTTSLQRKSLLGHTDYVTCLAHCGNRLFSGSRDQTIRAWDVEEGGPPLATLTGHTSYVQCLQAWNGKLVSGSQDRTIKVWDIDLNVCIQTLDCFDAVKCFHVMDNWAVTGVGSTVQIFDMSLGVCPMGCDQHALRTTTYPPNFEFLRQL